MGYVDIGDVADEGTIETTWGDQVRANFQAGVPDIFTTEGDVAIATGADAATRLAAGAQGSGFVMGAARPEWSLQPAARVYNSAAIDPATSSWVTLTFDSERYDTNGVHEGVTNPSRLTIPTNGGGIYHIAGNVEFDTNNAAAGQDVLGLRILLGGATVIAQRKYNERHGDSDASIPISCDYALAATNYLELQVYTDVDVDILASANFSPEFWLHWVRPTPP